MGTKSQADMFPPEQMPEIKSAVDLKRIIRPGSFSVLAKDERGIAQVRIGFSCKWDEEHGFAVLIHKGNRIEVGDSDLGI